MWDVCRCGHILELHWCGRCLSFGCGGSPRYCGEEGCDCRMFEEESNNNPDNPPCSHGGVEQGTTCPLCGETV